METAVRKKDSLYPDYTAEIEEIEKNGITEELLQRIIKKHRNNAIYNKGLYERYEAIDGAVPIFTREPRFDDEEKPINNKLNNDFFGEIIDFKTGYFAGKPVSYSYSDTEESKDDTGGEEARDIASKVLTDFVTRNNMYDVDMEVTKMASICGYAGRLLYHDEDGNERVMPVKPFECIVLSNTSITEPQYAVRYYMTTDIHDNEVWHAEFYDSEKIKYYEGSLSSLKDTGKEDENLYGYCPLQAIPNNGEMLGDAEKVLTLIDGYDRALSDNSNDVESFSNAYMIFENVNMDEKERTKGQRSGAFQYWSGSQSQGKIYFLTKDVNDAFTENHLNRLEDNIYRFSKTLNLNDETFGTASGVSLKFRLTGLETKCGMFQAKMQSAGVYMFKLLAESWRKKRIDIDPLQCCMDFKRNFPLDLLSEAQSVQALINAGVPKRVAYAQLSFVDDVQYLLDEIEAEKEDIPSLLQPVKEDEETGNQNGNDSGDGDLEEWTR